MWPRLPGSSIRRRWSRWRTAPGPLKDYYRHDVPAPDTPYDRVEFLAVDLETTGLDPETDEILSIGFVPVIGGHVRLAGAAHLLVRPSRPIPEETAVIHGLLDDALEAAPPLAEALPRLLEALSGRVAIAHHSRIERRFLNAACRRLYGRPLDAPFVCTMVLERRHLVVNNRAIENGALRLGASRARYGLPRYPVHNALTDALAAAELFLAQAAHASGRKPASLASLMD